MSSVRRLLRVSMTTADAGRTEAFYRDALGFELAAREERAGETFAALAGLPGARASVTVLRLGEEAVELVAFAKPGRSYPAGSTSFDLWFQHIAIVVSKMDDAYARLSATPGWTAISTAGPQRLPESSGGVTAFKFRDPEGHPLELLQFQPGKVPPTWQGRHSDGPCLGIDHSAIVVAETTASMTYYRQLGFAVADTSLNRGEEQEHLDDAPGAVVEVTALAVPGAPGPHLELLCYRHPRGRPAPPMASNDVAATRLILETDNNSLRRRPATLLHDPDGHDLFLRAFAADETSE